MDTQQLDHTQSLADLTSTLSAIGLSDVPTHTGTYPALNPVDIYRSHIAEKLASIAKVDLAIAYNTIQWTQSLDKGDLVCAVPALRVKGKKPLELAAEIVEQFPETALLQKPTADGTFLKFLFKPLPLAKIIIPSILRNASSYGFNRNLGLKDPADPSKGRKKIIVEFSSPNIAKPFHAGHLRSTIIGGFLANLYQGAGWDVVRMNYLGDWGKQYGVLALGFERFGSEEELVKNPIGHLYDVYVKISAISREETDGFKARQEEIKAIEANGEDASESKEQLQKDMDAGVDEAARKYFKRMVDGDEAALGVWKRFRDLSIERYKQTYARLNIEYDDYSGESTVKDESMDKAAITMAETKVSEDSEGAVIVDLTRWDKKLGKAVVKKKDGTSLYLTRDIGAMAERVEKYKFDKMIYVVGSQQDLHLKQLFKIVEVMGLKDVAAKCEHINFGMVKGMSTRKGTAKFLDDILRDVGDYMHEVMQKNADKYAQVDEPEKTADILGISAVMVQDMTGKRVNNYEFDMARMCGFEGDTGPYLQYAHARLSSIVRRVTDPPTPDELATANFELLVEPQAVNLVRALAQWPDVFLNTIKTREPITVLTYLFKMTHALSSSYDHLRIVGSEKELLKARLALYMCARQVLNNGMRLLGLTPLDR